MKAEQMPFLLPFWSSFSFCFLIFRFLKTEEINYVSMSLKMTKGNEIR